MSINNVLLALMCLSILVWVGGAITGQIWMFRAGVRHDHTIRAALIPYINWIIRSVYVPMASTACACGLLLVWRLGIPLTAAWLLFPLLVFVGTIGVGSFYSLPEYARIVTLLGANDPRDPRLQQRIEIAAWVNRIELFFVLIGLIGIVLQAPI